MNRRHFIVTGIAAAVAGGALATACSNKGGLRGLLPGSSAESGAGELASGGVYVLKPQYASVNLAGYKMRLRTYNGKTVGPMMVTQPGARLKVKIQNQLPKNPTATPQTGRVTVPRIDNSMQAMDPHYRGPRVPAGNVDPMNNPHDFNTTNLHVHGIQTVPHLFEPVGTSNPSAEMIAVEPGKELQLRFRDSQRSPVRAALVSSAPSRFHRRRGQWRDGRANRGARADRRSSGDQGRKRNLLRRSIDRSQ